MAKSKEKSKEKWSHRVTFTFDMSQGPLRQIRTLSELTNTPESLVRAVLDERGYWYSRRGGKVFIPAHRLLTVFAEKLHEQD